ncbi:MAG: RagB/SusD family nutrient uptake outer membrane protein [Paludibacteraceae bacterium]|nr:RagB/SusD family nutrient uptake outer membrane protein [Paludibacteraceae bacterium]
MKNNKFFLAVSLLAVGLLASCSLDREPHDPMTVTKFDQDAVFAKIYATFGTTGQKGPDGSGDVDGIDEGTSSFYRMFWELNEFCTDDGWWIWNDVGLAEIRTQEWDKANALVRGLYSRLYFDITLCNHFLDKTREATDEKTLKQIAEVRMIRAINYYYMVDMFCGGPMCLTVTPDNPMPATRSEMYRWLVAECKDLCGDDNDISADTEAAFKEKFPAHTIRPYGNNLPDTRESTYRVDRSVAWFLLMRLYLNQPIYASDSPSKKAPVGNCYHSAAWYASRVIKESGRHLLTGDAANYVASPDSVQDDVATYSAYQKLFMGDNDKNGAQDEALLLIYQDANFCQSWGGARFVINACRDGNMVPSGSADSWSCFRTSPELIKLFFSGDEAEATRAHEYEMPIHAQDDRATFCSYYVKSDSARTTTEWTLAGGKAADFYASWADAKWTGIYSTSKNPYVWASPVGEALWPDTDIPLFRVAEAYLTYAEAVLQGGNEAQGLTAKECVDAIRNRAHASTDYTLDTDFMLKEWAREFHAEGIRRTVLVRYGQFAGDAASMTWEGHTAGRDAKYNVYPIPETDETANKNLVGLNAAIGY